MLLPDVWGAAVADQDSVVRLAQALVRFGLVAQVPVRRQPVGQALRGPARGGQEGQEVRQARPHGRDGLAALPALAQQETRHLSHAEDAQVIDTRVVQVAQEPADRLVFRGYGRSFVATVASALPRPRHEAT